MRIHFLVLHPRDVAPGQRLKFEQYYERFRCDGHYVVHDAFYTPTLYQRLGQPGLWGKVCLLAWACLRRVSSLWHAWRSDLVYLFLEAVPAGPPILEWVIVRLFKRPMVYDIDDRIYLKKPGSRDPFPTVFNPRQKVEFLMRVARHVVVCTPHLEKEARGLNDRVTRISSTIDTSKYTPKVRYETSRVTLGWSGSFSTSEYLHLLDNVLRILQSRYGVGIRVIGDPGFTIQGVEIDARPWILQSEVEDLLDIDIGLYPLPCTEWDLGKSGLKALQYMGLGIPTVLNPFGANLEIVEHGKSGFFANAEEEWIEVLSLLILDPALRERIGKAGRRIVEARYSVEANWPLYRMVVTQEDS